MAKMIDIAAFIVHKDGKFIVEKRKLTKKNDPGKIVLPSGHVENGESFEETCKRELKEELGLDCNKFTFVTKLPHKIKTNVKEAMIHFYLCEDWKGELVNNEAEEIFWIGSKELQVLDFDIDRIAIKETIKKLAKGNLM